MNENLNDYATSVNSDIIEEAKEKKPCFFKNLSKVKIILLSIAAVLLVTAITVLCVILGEINGKNLKEPVSFRVEKGSSTYSVAYLLKDNDVINFPFVFRVYTKFKGFDNQFKYGNYTFEGKTSYFDICNKLINEGETAKSVTVTIPEGTSIYDYTKDVNGEDVTVPGIATLLEKAGVCTKADFFETLNKLTADFDVFFNDSKLVSGANKEKAYVALEGYLFPDTYDFYNHESSECAVLAISRMIEQSEKMITDDMHKRAESLGYSMNEILTLASIIQLESGQNTAEMPNVAAVFYNRLKQGGTLGSSPTCYYGNAFSNDDGRYDTYKVIGLPPGPLCSPGIDAINAVLWPTENSPYYYFVTDKNGKFYYHKTFAEQQNTVNKLQNEGNWIYEYLN